MNAVLAGLFLFLLPPGTAAQDARVSVTGRLAVKEVFKKIEAASPYRFFYSDNIAFFNSTVNADYADKSVKDILSDLLQGSNLTYKLMENDAIVISPFDVKNSQVVTGVVTDETGFPLPGVVVLVKGTAIGTSTDAQGKYSINVSTAKSPVLQYNFIGMIPVERNAIGGTAVDVRMEGDVQQLDAVVSIGYGTVAKKDLTGSVASISGETLANMPVASVAEAITGRLAGVQVTTTEGNPDAEIMIRVRGGGSITQDNSPLYIVDGFQSNEGLNALNPSDIESIDVLKDASSTAIYGSRGANGVILITTKKGSDGRAKVSYNGYMGIRKITKFLDVLSPYEYVMAQYEAAFHSSASALESFINKYGPYDQLGSYLERDGVDWQKEVFGRTALIQNHDFTVTGGTNTSKYAVKYTRFEEEGVMVASSSVRDYIKVSLDQQVTKRLKMNVNGSFSNRSVVGGFISGTQSSGALANIITFRPVNGIGQVDEDLIREDEDPDSDNLTNPLVKAEAQYKKKTYRTTNFNGSFAYQITDDLTFTLSGGMTSGNDRVYTFYDERLADAREKGGPYGGIEQQESMQATETALLQYSKVFGGKHNVSAMAGQELVSALSKKISVNASQFPNSDIGLDNLTLAAVAGPLSSTIIPERLFSYFGRLNYSFMGRYYLTASMRSDGSSKFGGGRKWANFPSFAVAWRASEESFVKEMDIFDNLKFRFSYGSSGNCRIANNLYTSIFDITYYAQSGNSHSTAVYPKNPQNPFLKWETTIASDLGIDIGLLKSKLNVTIDLYKNKTKDLLLNARIPGTTGYTTQQKNVGSTQNKGIEISVNSVNLSRGNFVWTSDFNISFNRGKITGLNKDELGATNSWLEVSNWSTAANVADYIVMVGKPVGQIYGYIYDGWYTAEDFEGYDQSTGKWILKDDVPRIKGATGIMPGDMKFKWISGTTENGIPVITPDGDRTIIGDTNPKFVGGFNNTFRYKNLDLSVFVNFNYGNKILNANKIAYTNTYQRNRNFLGIMRGAFTLLDHDGQLITDLDDLAARNQHATIYRSATGQLPRYNYSMAVEDGSFLRINTITLGYSLPKKIIERIKLQHLRVYGTAYNIYTWTNYSGYDPEVSSLRKSPLTPGVDYSAYPKSFSLVFGLNVTF